MKKQMMILSIFSLMSVGVVSASDVLVGSAKPAYELSPAQTEMVNRITELASATPVDSQKIYNALNDLTKSAVSIVQLEAIGNMAALTGAIDNLSPIQTYNLNNGATLKANKLYPVALKQLKRFELYNTFLSLILNQLDAKILQANAPTSNKFKNDFRRLTSDQQAVIKELYRVANEFFSNENYKSMIRLVDKVASGNTLSSSEQILLQKNLNAVITLESANVYNYMLGLSVEPVTTAAYYCLTLDQQKKLPTNNSIEVSRRMISDFEKTKYYQFLVDYISQLPVRGFVDVIKAFFMSPAVVALPMAVQSDLLKKAYRKIDEFDMSEMSLDNKKILKEELSDIV